MKHPSQIPDTQKAHRQILPRHTPPAATRRDNSEVCLQTAYKLLFVDKSLDAGKSEILGVFISSFNELSKQVFKDFISFHCSFWDRWWNFHGGTCKDI